MKSLLHFDYYFESKIRQMNTAMTRRRDASSLTRIKSHCCSFLTDKQSLRKRKKKIPKLKSHDLYARHFSSHKKFMMSMNPLFEAFFSLLCERSLTQCNTYNTVNSFMVGQNTTGPPSATAVIYVKIGFTETG